MIERVVVVSGGECDGGRRQVQARYTAWDAVAVHGVVGIRVDVGGTDRVESGWLDELNRIGARREASKVVEATGIGSRITYDRTSRVL